MAMFGGKHYDNPAYGRGMERSAGVGKVDPSKKAAGPTDGAGHNHPPAFATHVHKTGEGKFHLIGHHDGGSHETDHSSAEEAHEDAKACMEGDGSGDDMGEINDAPGGGGGSWMK